jgi:trk system potassium uptake protein TrkA
LREIGLPDGMLVGAVVRNGDVIMPTGETRVQPGDSIIAVVTYRALKKAEAMLAGRESVP